jgi:hypothetical protein
MSNKRGCKIPWGSRHRTIDFFDFPGFVSHTTRCSHGKFGRLCRCRGQLIVFLSWCWRDCWGNHVMAASWRILVWRPCWKSCVKSYCGFLVMVPFSRPVVLVTRNTTQFCVYFSTFCRMSCRNLLQPFMNVRIVGMMLVAGQGSPFRWSQRWPQAPFCP